jgi:serine/threonine-protein phosphatase PGAM5
VLGEIGAVPLKSTDLLREAIPTAIAERVTTPAQVRADRSRADRAYERLFRPSRADRTELVVCHGNIIRYLVCRGLGVPVSAWSRMAMQNCGITRVRVREGGVTILASHNEIAHLPKRMRSA